MDGGKKNRQGEKKSVLQEEVEGEIGYRGTEEDRLRRERKKGALHFELKVNETE